jgi:hypothetical protein
MPPTQPVLSPQKSQPGCHSQLPVWRVVDVRVLSDTNELPAPIDIHAYGPGPHHQPIVASPCSRTASMVKRQLSGR